MSYRNYGKGKIQMTDDASQIKFVPPASKCCEIFDNLLEPHVAEYIDAKLKEVHWKYDYNSNKKIGIQPHWHVLCGKTEEGVISNGFDFLLDIWQAAAYKLNLKKDYNIVGWRRLYLNAHTHGVEPHMHSDDGDFTMMYYPRLDWKPEWLGGTAIWDDEGKNINRFCNYIGNRLLVFPAHNKHQAMPVSKFCYELRPVVVFKLYVGAGNVDRLDYYKK